MPAKRKSLAASGKRVAKPAVKRSPRVARSLSKEIVVAAALDEIDRHGFENFSLRNLAKTLGVFPTAVTWYVPTRRQILAEVVKLVLADLSPDRFYESWQDYIRLVCIEFRNAIRLHPSLAPLIATQLVANPTIDLGFVERLLSALRYAGFKGPLLVAAYNSVIVAMVGFPTQEFGPVPEEETQDWREDTKKRLESVSSAEYPTIAEHMSLLQNKAFILRWDNGTEAPMTASFDVFVGLIIGGLESLLRRDVQTEPAA